MNKDVIHTVGIKDKKSFIGIDRIPKIIGLDSHVIDTGIPQENFFVSGQYHGYRALRRLSGGFGEVIDFAGGQSGTSSNCSIHPFRELYAMGRTGSSGTMQVIRDLNTFSNVWTRENSCWKMCFSEDYCFMNEQTDAARLYRLDLNTLEHSLIAIDTDFSSSFGAYSDIAVHKTNGVYWWIGNSLSSSNGASTLHHYNFDGIIASSPIKFSGGNATPIGIDVAVDGSVFFSRRFRNSPATFLVYKRTPSLGSVWFREFSGLNSIRKNLAVDMNGDVYVTNNADVADKGLWKLSGVNGSTIWHNSDYRLSSVAVDRNGIVYTGGVSHTDDGLFFRKFDANTGNFIEQSTVESTQMIYDIDVHPGRIGAFH